MFDVTGTTVTTPRPRRWAAVFAPSLLTMIAGRCLLASAPRTGSIGSVAGAAAGDVKAGIEAATSLGRYATPEEIAATAAWILSDEVPYCHGEIFTVGGA